MKQQQRITIPLFCLTAAMVLLAIVLSACNNRVEKPLSKVNMTTVDSTANSGCGSSYYTIFKKELTGGGFLEFFIIREEEGCQFKIYDSTKNQFWEDVFKPENGEDISEVMMNEGMCGIYGFVTPDEKYVYVIGFLCANSTGWIYDYTIYQVNTETYEAKYINSVAAIKLERDGFTVASMTRKTTPEAKYSYQMRFAFEDITYDFDGKVKKKSKEYHDTELKKRYNNRFCNVKGVGAER